MSAKIRSAGTLSTIHKGPYACFSVNFTELQQTNIQINYWVVQMYCGPPNQKLCVGHCPPCPLCSARHGCLLRCWCNVLPPLLKSGLSRVYYFVNICTIGGDLVRGLGGRGRRVSAEKFFLPSPPKCEIWGGRRGTHCIRELQYSTHGFCVYIVDFVDFNI